jgi:ketosteroid isomerase-like protein
VLAVSLKAIAKEEIFVEGKDFHLSSGQIEIKSDSVASFAYPADNPFIGVGHETQVLGLDARGDARIQESATFAGTAFLVVPVAGNAKEVFRFPRSSALCNGASMQATAKDQVWAAELAFARTMADRNLSGFSEFVAEEAIFFAGTSTLRGKPEVIEGWAQYFTGAEAPFSWEPDQVEVLESGRLAFSTGPVRDPAGKVIARFNSVWRLEASGQWRVVFDKGSPAAGVPAGDEAAR